MNMTERAAALNITADTVYDHAADPSRVTYRWQVTLRRAGRQLTVPFTMGVAYGGREPTAAEVLECLASDAAGYLNAGSLAEYAAEYGQADDEDGKEIAETYRLVGEQTEGLRRLLGDEFDAVVWETS